MIELDTSTKLLIYLFMDQSDDSIIIDGNLYEGGGQMLRISLALSVIF
jgi:hypothetical protein